MEIALLRGGHYGISIEVEGFKAHGGGPDRRFNIEPQGDSPAIFGDPNGHSPSFAKNAA